MEMFLEFQCLSFFAIVWKIFICGMMKDITNQTFMYLQRLQNIQDCHVTKSELDYFCVLFISDTGPDEEQD